MKPPKLCIHGTDLNSYRCWCTYRKGKYGLVNGQMVEFNAEGKVEKFLPKNEHALEGWSH